MSFISELRESLEILWPQLELHGEVLDCLDISLDFAGNEITVTLTLDEDTIGPHGGNWGNLHGYSASATIPWSDSIESLMAKLSREISSLAENRVKTAQALQDAATAEADSYRSAARALKDLDLSPLEELAQQAE